MQHRNGTARGHRQSRGGEPMSTGRKSKLIVTLTRAQATQLANAADKHVRTLPPGPDRRALDCAYEILETALAPAQSNSNDQPRGNP